VSWQVGDVRVTRVPQMTWHIPLWGLVPEATDAACAEVAPGLVDGKVEVSLHGLVLEAGDRRILVDTCAGHDAHADRILGLVSSAGTIEHHHRSVGEAVGAAGWSAGDIDTVVCTHLHFDHIGGVDGFPAARFVLAGDEWDHWSTATDADDYESIDAGIRPLVDAGRVDLVDGDHALTDEVRLVATPGHTPGHVSVEIASSGETAVITGDLVHHPIELLAPHWSMVYDVDPAQATASRRAFVDRYGDGETLLLGTHFGGSSAGRFDASSAMWTAA
jgi:glyoxylase-like metal-dependent hydrolase (beta-lactamase superfamily II)